MLVTTSFTLLGVTTTTSTAVLRTPSGLPCNQTSLQLGERVLTDPSSGNTSIVPILINVSTATLEGCHENRSSACLSTCNDFGYKVCFPDVDPFDLCVQSCIANLTYFETYEFDHTLSVCKKKLRLTPSQPSRRGAAWYRRKQHVREGFRTSFAFRLEHPSRRCPDVAHPSFEEQPEGLRNLLCSGRGGDGFAFVIQDAGATSFDPHCAYAAVDQCNGLAAAQCTEQCRSQCPNRVAAEHTICAAACLKGDSYTMPPVAALGSAVERAAYAAAAAAAAGACSASVVRCVASACGGREVEFFSGAAMQPGGCLRDCLDAGSRTFCEARCPLVDEDVDDDCVSACANERLADSTECFRGCNASCASQGLLEQAMCAEDCLGGAALLASGEPVGRCRAKVQAFPTHETATCLTSCSHTDHECLRACLETPEGLLPNCVGACPQNNTRCVLECMRGFGQRGSECVSPRVLECNYTSSALGDGAAGIGYANLRNTLAIKFDTWYNAERLDPWVSHVAVHSGGEDYGAPSDTSAALAITSDFPDIADQKYHEVIIEYVPRFETDGNLAGMSITPGIAARLTTAQRGNMLYVGTLKLTLDDAVILRVPLNLETLLRLDQGRAYVGFTGATGSAYQEHSIHAWRFQESVSGTLAHPANEHCRHRVPSLWHGNAYDGAPVLPANAALACTPDVMDVTTPLGAMHSLRCTEDASGYVYCLDPNTPNSAPIIYEPMPDISVLVGEPVNITLHDGFRDRQSDGRYTSHLLRYSLIFTPHNEEPQDGIAWVQFNSSTRQLRGIPTHPGTWRVNMTAIDPGFPDAGRPTTWTDPRMAPMNTTDEFLLQVRVRPIDPLAADFWAPTVEQPTPTEAAPRVSASIAPY